MLVDFGRAKDLKGKSGGPQQDVKFVGHASPRDMMCVAMRKNLPWSFDIDTFGVCASVHVLLFGSHIQIHQSREQRWMPNERFRRYHEKDLWVDVFDTLLNLECGTQEAIGSRPESLRRLRHRIESHLSTKIPSQRLVSALKRQATLLPATRLV